MKSIYDSEAEKKLQQHYKIKSVAELYDISEKTVRRWIRAGKLKANRIGGSIRIPRHEIEKFIKPMES